jgi:hypothetical protein
MWLTVASGIGLLMISGCTSAQLRKDTAREARTLSQIYEQQVLDNLAKFVYDLNAMPHFALADGGSVQVQDQLNGNGSASWTKGGPLNAAGFQIGGQRQLTDSWTTTPISDPRKLELMRCAYQRAVSGALCYGQDYECKNCEQLVRLFYTGNAGSSIEAERRNLKPPAVLPCPEGAAPGPSPLLDQAKGLGAGANVNQQQQLTDLYGYTADDLKINCCWFHVCCAKCIGKHRHECCKVGEYCGVYVVVEPGVGQEMLSRLTLVILDFAQYQAVTPEKKDQWQINMKWNLERRIDYMQSRIAGTEEAFKGASEDRRKSLLAEYSAEVKDLKDLVDTHAALTKSQATAQAGQSASGARQLSPNAVSTGMLPFLQRESVLMGAFQ